MTNVVLGKFLILGAVLLALAACMNEPAAGGPANPGKDSTGTTDTLPSNDTLPPADTIGPIDTVVPVRIGDFAPLKVGNVWVYKGDLSEKFTCNSLSSSTKFIHSLTLLSRRQSSDTLTFLFSFTDSTFYQNTPPPPYGPVNPSVSTRVDSIVEMPDGTMGAGTTHLRYFDKHLVFDTAATGNMLLSGESHKTYTVSTGTPGVLGQIYSVATYAQDIGLTRYVLRWNGGCSIRNETDSLFSFTPGSTE